MWWSVAGATTLRVDPGDALAYPSVAAAVAASQPGDVVWLTLAGSPYTEAGVPVDHALEVRCDPGVRWVPAAPGLNGAVRVNAPGSEVRLRDLAFDGSDTGRFAVVDAGRLVLDHVTVANTGATIAGGAVYAGPNAESVRVQRSAFDTSSVPANATGGFVRVAGGDLTVLDSTFRLGISGNKGGALAVDGGGDLVITGSTFESCVGSSGAAVWFRHAGTVSIADATFRANVTLNGRAAALWVEAETVSTTITGSEFHTNVTDGTAGGGALYVDDGAVAIADTWFVSNGATNGPGGAVVVDSPGAATIDTSWFCGNSADTEGGSLRVKEGATAVVATVFEDDVAIGSSGTVYATFPTTFTQVTVTGAAASSAPALGEGDQPGDLHLDRVLVTDTLGGVAVDARHPGATEVDACWFWGNTDDTTAVVTHLAPSTTSDPGVAPPAAGCSDPWVNQPGPASPVRGSGVGAWEGGFPGRPLDLDGDGELHDDCDDNDPDIHRGADEQVGDGIDQDCDGIEFCYRDADLDGVGVDVIEPSTAGCAEPGLAPTGPAFDCDDADDARTPGRPEVPGDGVDQDCDGSDACFEDADGDGFGTALVPIDDPGCVLPGHALVGGDCDDDDAGSHPGAVEVEGDGVDQDCDGQDTPPPPGPHTGVPVGTHTGPGPAPTVVSDPGCGCRGAPGAGGWLVFGAAAMVRRRRGWTRRE